MYVGNYANMRPPLSITPTESTEPAESSTLLLDSIPGLGPTSSKSILSEIGVNMSASGCLAIEFGGLRLKIGGQSVEF